MSANTKRVFYVKSSVGAVSRELLQARGDVRLDRPGERQPRGVGSAGARGCASLSGGGRGATTKLAHICIMSTEFLVGGSRTADRVEQRSRYDPVNTKACTKAGVLVLNQAGGNRQSVAEHVLAMLLALSKRSARPTGSCAARPRLNRNAYLATTYGKTVGIVGLGHVGSTWPSSCAACSHACRWPMTPSFGR